MDQPIRVLIADDHIHAREAIREILAPHKDFEIVAEAKNGREALLLTEDVMPDIILMDINMPIMDGFEATKQIKAIYPYVKIIMITVSHEVTNLFEAIKKGAQGYLLKNLDATNWYTYIKGIATDDIPMSKEIALSILQELAPQKKHIESPLSPREQEVLELVSQGKKNKQISLYLGISEYTVKNHLKNIMQKLHLENRVQLTRYAFEKGWV